MGPCRGHPRARSAASLLAQCHVHAVLDLGTHARDGAKHLESNMRPAVCVQPTMQRKSSAQNAEPLHTWRLPSMSSSIWSSQQISRSAMLMSAAATKSFPFSQNCDRSCTWHMQFIEGLQLV